MELPADKKRSSSQLVNLCCQNIHALFEAVFSTGYLVTVAKYLYLLRIEKGQAPVVFSQWSRLSKAKQDQQNSIHERTATTHYESTLNLSVVLHGLKTPSSTSCRRQDQCFDRGLLLFWLTPSCCAVLLVMVKRLTANALEEICFFMAPIVMLNSWVTIYNFDQCVVLLSIPLRICSWYQKTWYT